MNDEKSKTDSLSDSAETMSQRMFVAPTLDQGVDGTACIFCGNPLTGQRSREHVFPRWLMREFDTLAQPFSVTWTDDADGSPRESRELVMGNLVAGRVCRTCNNGWMSQLEQAASGLLLDVATGRRPLAGLDADERRLLSRWVAKTAFAARSAAPGPQLVPPAQASALVDGNMPNVRVVARQAPLHIGFNWYATQRWMVTYPPGARAEVERLVSTSHKTVLTIGQAIFAVCSWPDENWPIAISQRSHTPLWPVTGDWLTYPHATDQHEVAPSAETEIIDIVIGTRVTHPTLQAEFQRVDAMKL